MKMKIVIAIVMLHYNIACLKAQIPVARSMDYIRDYYDADGNPNNGNEASDEPESDEYSDEPLNEQELQFWEALLKLLKNKYPSFRPESTSTKYDSYSGKGPAMYQTQRPSMNPPQKQKYPNGHPSNPYQNQGQPMPGGGNTTKQSCILKKTMCVRRCAIDLRCKKGCNMRFPC